MKLFMCQWLCIIISVDIIQCQKKDLVSQMPSSLIEPEGGSVTLHCTYETSSNPYMFWYRQRPGQYLEYLARVDYVELSYVEEAFRGRISIKHYKVNSTAPLTVTDLLMEDTAVYFCALSPTKVPLSPKYVQKLCQCSDIAIFTTIRCQVFQDHQIRTTEGQEAIISCHQNASGHNTMVWYKKGLDGRLVYLSNGYDGEKDAGTFVMMQEVLMVVKQAQSSSKEIQAGSGCMSVSTSICQHLNEMKCSGMRSRRTPLLKNRYKKARMQFAKMKVEGFQDHSCSDSSMAEINLELYTFLKTTLTFYILLTSVKGNDAPQSYTEKTVREGDTLTIDCSYTSTKYVLIWYVQKPGGSIIFLLHDQSKKEDLHKEFKQRISATHYPENKTFPLTIKSIQRSDTGMYYCALENGTVCITLIGAVLKLNQLMKNYHSNEGPQVCSVEVNGECVIALLDAGSLVTLVRVTLDIYLIPRRKMKVSCSHGDVKEYPVSRVIIETNKLIESVDVGFTVHVGGRSLAFQQGTRLIVEPGDNRITSPSVFVLKSEKENPLVACLVKDFYPKYLKIYMNSTTKSFSPDKVPIKLSPQGKYSAALVANLGTKNVQCQAKHQEKWVTNIETTAKLKGLKNQNKERDGADSEKCQQTFGW
ncbi:uncharacterized protein LOC142244242 [Anomaloglossus baeobatrachus]|uniref:uncharacterized protein LOC142244242 n=1 Tax=Anomaloglossus baeobatrachus TaxID=238106 RepID=UPI003F4F6586